MKSSLHRVLAPALAWPAIAGLAAAVLVAGCRGAEAPPPAGSAQAAPAKVVATVSEPRLVSKAQAHPPQASGVATPKPAAPKPAPPEPAPRRTLHAHGIGTVKTDSGAHYPPDEGPAPAPPPAPAPVTAAPQPAAPPRAPDTTDTLLKTYKQALRAGFIDYNPPGQMTVGASQTIVVRLRRTALPPTAPGLPVSAGGSTSTQQLSLYPQMRVTLDTNSGGAFQITPSAATPASQVIPDEGYAEWRWTVAPLIAGPDKSLVVTAWADLGDRDGVPQTILVAEYQAIITVMVAPAPPPPSMGARVGKFVASNWQWLWTALLVPLAGWLIPRLSRKKKGDEPG